MSRKLTWDTMIPLMSKKKTIKVKTGKGTEVREEQDGPMSIYQVQLGSILGLFRAHLSACPLLYAEVAGRCGITDEQEEEEEQAEVPRIREGDGDGAQ